MAANNICLRCNTPNQAGARFCRGCGQPLAVVAPPQPVPHGPSPRPAAPVGPPPQPISPGQPAQSPPARPVASPRTKFGFNYIWLGIGFGLILLCGLLGVIGLYFSPYWPGLPDEMSLPTGVAVASPVPTTSLPTVSTPIVTPPLAITTTVPLEVPAVSTPVSTSTPALTSTPGMVLPTPSPLPPITVPSTTLPPPPITPPPPPAAILFRDDFDTNLKPDWGAIQADNKSVVNGQLVLEGASKISLYPGKTDWTDYTVSLATTAQTNLTDLALWVRVQDEQNYLKMECVERVGDSSQLDCHWLRIAAGQITPVPGTNFTMPKVGQFAVEIKGDVYRVIGPELVFTDLNQTVKFGGVALEAQAMPLTLDYFEVTGPPQ